MKSVVVIGLGNTMRRDDGVGPAAVALLEDSPPPGTDVVGLDGEATRVIDAWQGRNRAIVIDAVLTGEPAGTIHEVEVGRDALPDWHPGPSSHGAGVAEAVALGRALGRLPEELIVLGVEPADVSHGPDLTAAVADALPGLVDRVRERAAR